MIVDRSMCVPPLLWGLVFRQGSEDAIVFVSDEVWSSLREGSRSAEFISIGHRRFYQVLEVEYVLGVLAAAESGVYRLPFMIVDTRKDELGRALEAEAVSFLHKLPKNRQEAQRYLQVIASSYVGDNIDVMLAIVRAKLNHEDVVTLHRTYSRGDVVVDALRAKLGLGAAAVAESASVGGGSP